jgi:osmotically-inducible protein OsmY
MQKPNIILASDVKDSLAWDPGLDDSRIVVTADDGHVTLRGVVATYYQELLATQDAWSVGGVRTLDDELLVGLLGDATADADLMLAADGALRRDHIVPHGAVTATVAHGIVTLRGQVRHRYQRQAGEYAVSRIGGVLGVENLIAIVSDPVPSDVAARIDKALQRSAILDGAQILVTNEGHTISLDGTVGSHAARLAAEDTAWAAPGVTDVVDRLVIAT